MWFLLPKWSRRHQSYCTMVSSCEHFVSVGSPQLWNCYRWSGRVFPRAAAACLALLLCDLALSSPKPRHSPLLDSGQNCDCFVQEGWNSLEELLRKRTRLENKKMICYVTAESLVTLVIFFVCVLQCNCFCNDMEKKNQPKEWVDLAKEIWMSRCQPSHFSHIKGTIKF